MRNCSASVGWLWYMVVRWRCVAPLSLVSVAMSWFVWSLRPDQWANLTLTPWAWHKGCYICSHLNPLCSLDSSPVAHWDSSKARKTTVLSTCPSGVLRYRNCKEIKQSRGMWVLCHGHEPIGLLERPVLQLLVESSSASFMQTELTIKCNCELFSLLKSLLFNPPVTFRVNLTPFNV